MLPCSKCGYAGSIPGDCHIQCTYDWSHASPEIQKDAPVNHHGGRTQQWFMFPFNFDPVWGPDSCPAQSETTDPKMVVSDPLFSLISLLR